MSKLNTFTKANGMPTLPGKETADFLLNQHFPSATAPSNVRYTHKAIESAVLANRYEEWLSKDKIISALDEFESKKSPGPDGLKPIIFKYVSDNVIDTLQIIYKATVALAYTPRLWKETRAVSYTHLTLPTIYSV